MHRNERSQSSETSDLVTPIQVISLSEIRNEVKHFENVRSEVKLASGDYVDLKAYEPDMRHLIDTYIRADESETISNFDDKTLVELLVDRGPSLIKELPASYRQNKEAAAETIENNIRKVVVERKPTNPKYYEKMSVLLDEVIKARRKDMMDYEEYLKKIVEIAQKTSYPESSTDYPTTMNTSGKRALYDNLDKNEILALAVDGEIFRSKYDDWRGKKVKEKVERSVDFHGVVDGRVVLDEPLRASARWIERSNPILRGPRRRADMEVGIVREHKTILTRRGESATLNGEWNNSLLM